MCGTGGVLPPLPQALDHPIPTPAAQLPETGLLRAKVKVKGQGSPRPFPPLVGCQDGEGTVGCREVTSAPTTAASAPTPPASAQEESLPFWPEGGYPSGEGRWADGQGWSGHLGGSANTPSSWLRRWLSAVPVSSVPALRLPLLCQVPCAEARAGSEPCLCSSSLLAPAISSALTA